MVGKILASICAVAVLISVYGFFTRYNKLSNPEFVEVMASTVNSDAPKAIREGIRLDGAEANGAELITKYTFVDFGEGEADAEALLAMIKPGAISQACSNEESLSAFARGITFTYW